MKKIKVIVLEDEPVSREWLISKLNYFEELEVLGSGASIYEGIELIKLHKPDAMFVDIELKGEGNIFDMVTKLNDLNIQIPITVVTTAYPDYIFTAINDYSQYIVQYIVKPFAFEWQDKINKSINAIDKRILNINVSHNQPKSEIKQSFLFLPINGAYVKVAFDDIIFLQAKDGDTFIYTDSKHYIVSITLTICLEKFPIYLFKRISRQYVVAINRIIRINKAERLLSIVYNGKQIELDIGDSYYRNLLDTIPIIGS